MEVEDGNVIKNLKSELETFLGHCRKTIDENFGDCKSEKASCNPNLAAFEGFLQNMHNQFERHFHVLETLIEAKNEPKPNEDINKVKEKEDIQEVDQKEETEENLGKRSYAFVKNVFASKDFDPTLSTVYSYTPIGILRSVFTDLYGVPRQGLLAPHTKAILKLRTEVQPSNSLKGLEKYSHCIILFVFHRNSNLRFNPMIFPPKLNGKKMGVFSTRSPHHWNNIGLTIAKIDKIEKDTIYFSGVDLLNGTPILDIKPYVYYDSLHDFQFPDWVKDTEFKTKITKVLWSEGTLDALKNFCTRKIDHMRFYSDPEEAQKAIEECILLDQRTVHMIEKHTEKAYGFCFDTVNIIFHITEDKETKPENPNQIFSVATIESVQSLKELYQEQKRTKTEEK